MNNETTHYVCAMEEYNFYRLLYGTIGATLIIAMLETLLIAYCWMRRRIIVGNKILESSKFADVEESGQDECSHFGRYVAVYIFQLKKDGNLSCKKYSNTEAKLALDDLELKSKLDSIKSNVSTYFDLNAFESPYYGFSPSKKETFAAYEKKLRLVEKKGGQGQDGTIKEEKSEIGSGVYEQFAVQPPPALSKIAKGARTKVKAATTRKNKKH